MKISCEREKLSQAFSLVASVAAVRDVKPVLQNVKISAESSGVMLQATDTELGIRHFLDECEVIETGEAILPTKDFRKILQEATVQTLQIENVGGKVLVTGDRIRFELMTQAADEFPNVEDFDESAYHEIQASVLKEMIRRTTFATDAENNQYSLGGVFFELIEEKASVVATDGRRLAFQEGTVSCVNDHRVESAIFPSRGLQLIERMLPNSGEESIKIAISPNRALFQTGSTVFFSRLVEGRFPKWRNVIPEPEGKAKIDVLAGPLFSAIRQAAILTTDMHPGVIFTFDKGKLELRANGAEKGSSAVEMPISFEGPREELKLNPKYMTDFLRVLDADKNLSLYVTADQPLSIRTDDAYVYVVMPLS